MKKTFILAASLLAASFANAQEPIGAQTTPSFATAPAATPEPEPAPVVDPKPSEGAFTTEIGFCPFVSSSVSLENGRLNAAYYLDDNLAIRAGLGFGYSSTENDNDNEETFTSFSFAPGIVYLFDGTQKFAPYVGGELIIGTSETTEKVGKTETTTSDEFNFGIQGFTGMNYYFAESLYVGVEFGLGFYYTKDDVAEVSTTSLRPFVQPSIRLGWAFNE